MQHYPQWTIIIILRETPVILYLIFYIMLETDEKIKVKIKEAETEVSLLSVPSLS